VKLKYNAWVTQAERDAIRRVLQSCPSEKLPQSGATRVPVVPDQRAPTPTPTPSKDEPLGRGRVFANCAEVRAAGLAPLVEGTADYRANPKLDRDKDGVACER
jgi:hypothetical protein